MKKNNLFSDDRTLVKESMKPVDQAGIHLKSTSLGVTGNDSSFKTHKDTCRGMYPPGSPVTVYFAGTANGYCSFQIVVGFSAISFPIFCVNDPLDFCRVPTTFPSAFD